MAPPRAAPCHKHSASHRASHRAFHRALHRASHEKMRPFTLCLGSEPTPDVVGPARHGRRGSAEAGRSLRWPWGSSSGAGDACVAPFWLQPWVGPPALLPPQAGPAPYGRRPADQPRGAARHPGTVHTATAHSTYGRSPWYIRLQPPTHAVAASNTCGCSLQHIRSQRIVHTVAACITYGCSLQYVRLQGIKFAANMWIHQFDFKTPSERGCQLTYARLPSEVSSR